MSSLISTFYLPTKLIFGPGSIAQLGSVAKEMGKKAVVVTGSASMRKTGVLDRALADLKSNGVQAWVFDKAEPNPRMSTVDEGARLARDKGTDLIIGLGGGSAMDTAKGMTVASTSTEPFWRYVRQEIEIRGPTLPLILVPTIAGSGSEASIAGAYTDWESHEKLILLHPLIYPKVSIVDPELTITVPKKTVARGGLDSFCHVMERYLTAPTPLALSDGVRETIMKLAVESLPQVLARPDDLEARIRLSWAGTLGNSPLVGELGGGAGALTLHNISHPFSGYYDAAHADTLAALLPAWMKYTYPAKKERFASLGRNVFGESDGISATEKWLERIGMKLRLRDFGAEPERFEEFAANAVKTAPVLVVHPLPLDVPAIVKIYQNSY
jgi:alcohol dehydrogenase YqhD (iron-dependent ADH family)